MTPEERTEWDVVWFPHDASEKTRTYKTKDAAEERFWEAHENGYAPLMMERTLIVSERLIRGYNSDPERAEPT